MEFLDLRIGAACGNIGSSCLVFFYRTEVATTEDGDRRPDEHDDFDNAVTTNIPEFDQCSCSAIVNEHGTAAELHHQHPGDVRPARTAELFMG